MCIPNFGLRLAEHMYDVVSSLNAKLPNTEKINELTSSPSAIHAMH